MLIIMMGINRGNIDWVMAADKVIGHLAPLLSITAYRQHLLAGLITACTSLSEALVILLLAKQCCVVKRWL